MALPPARVDHAPERQISAVLQGPALNPKR